MFFQGNGLMRNPHFNHTPRKRRASSFAKTLSVLVSTLLISLGFPRYPVLSSEPELSSEDSTEATPSANGTDDKSLDLDGDFTDLRLEELMDLEVTSVSKKKENLKDAPAAIYVITQEDLRRSGVDTIP